MFRHIQCDGNSICESIPLDEGRAAILDKIIAQNDVILRANCRMMEALTMPHVEECEECPEPLCDPDVEQMARIMRDRGKRVAEKHDARVREIILGSNTGTAGA